MFQRERLEKIVMILKSRGYVTVRALTEELHYSTATVNRDLNALEQMGKIKRSYGGAELAVPVNVPVALRYEQGRAAKKRIAKLAAEYVRDGDTVFMDGSTTVQYMGEYLLEKKDVTVITNNISLAAFLAEYGIAVTVLGGRVMEAPYMLAGTETVENAARYRAEKCFFSTAFVSREGEMSYTGDIYYSMHRTMIRNSDKSFYLVDGAKVDRAGSRVFLGDLSLVDCVISDYDFGDAVKERFEKVDFVCLDHKKELRQGD